jgi:hypothetical protein
MSRIKNFWPILPRMFLFFFILLGIALIFIRKDIGFHSALNTVQAELEFNNQKKMTIGLQISPGKTIRWIMRNFKNDRGRPEKIRLHGLLLTVKTANYYWGLDYSRPAFFSIDGNLIMQDGNSDRIAQIFISRGLHHFELTLYPDWDNEEFVLMWKNSKKERWKSVSRNFFFSDSARQYSITQLIDFQGKARIVESIYSFLVFLFMIIFIIFSFIYIGRSVSGFKSDLKSADVRGVFIGPGQRILPRFVEIDATKGFAAFLMVAGHCPGGNVLLTFVNLGAPLFFFCSGMNTSIFLEKTKNYRGVNGFQLFFILLLFFGGYTQIEIAHPGIGRIIPEFFQFIALGMLLIFILFKILGNSRFVGYLFFSPFLIYLLFRANLLAFPAGGNSFLKFFISKSVFPLFPWAGYLIFGIFILNIREKPKLFTWVLVVMGLASFLSVVIFKRPFVRYNMNLSYIFLSLFLLAALFFVFGKLVLKSGTGLAGSLVNCLALVGRNSLMFVYVHYFVLFHFLTGIPDQSSILELMFQSLMAFTLCAFFILAYEKVKNDYTLLVPVLLVTFLLFSLRHANLFAGAIDLRLIDEIIGILFAFLYVQLRGKLRVMLKKG